MKKKKTCRVYFIVHSGRRLPIEAEDLVEYPSSIACYTNKKDAKKDLTCIREVHGGVYEIVAFDLEF
jgi:hypothetical protein